MRQVVELLAKECNDSGGLLGKRIAVISEDDAGDVKTAVTAARKLVSRQPVAVIGTYGSGVTAAVQSVFDKAGIIQITNGSTSVRLTEMGFKYFFRICPRDDEQARTAAQIIMDAGYKKVAILRDTTLYSKRLASRTEALLKEAGIMIVWNSSLNPGQKDYRNLLGNIREKQPDVVFFTGYYSETGVLLRDKREQGWSVPWIGGDASYSSELVKTAGKEAIAGFHFLSLPLLQNLPSPEAKKFRPHYCKQYGKPLASVYGLLAGDAFKVIVAAIAATGTTEPSSVSRYLHSTMKDFPGLSGLISFNEKGDREGRVFVEYKVDTQGNADLQL
jgi:branched-chain amino acid transport system substrate-binding protein